MSLSIEKRFLAALAAVLGALVAYAALAPAAEATEVTPTNQTIKMENVGPTDFIPSNASTNPGVRCFESQLEFTVEDDNDRNKNQPNVGDKSTDHGSVTGPMDPNSRVPSPPGPQAPIWDDCHQWDFRENEPGLAANVTTTDQNGAWSIAAHASPTHGPLIAIGVPPQGAVITIGFPPFFGCGITVSNHAVGGLASTVTAEWENPDNDNGRARVDGQIDFTSAGAFCTGVTPAQFEGVYEPDRPVTIDP